MLRVYTVCLKTIHLTFDHDFGKCRPIFKILSLTDSQENSYYVTVTGPSTSP